MNLGRYVRQLEVLSKLRNLQALTIKKIEAMPLVYDLETDIRYKQGYENAEKNLQQKIANMQEKTVKKLLQIKILSKEYIAETAGVTVKYVEEVEKQLKTKTPKKKRKKRQNKDK